MPARVIGRGPMEGFTFCSHLGCQNKIKDHAWGYIKSSGEGGWFHQKDGSSWCPEHTPEWVGKWRAKKDQKSLSKKEKKVKKEVFSFTCDNCGTEEETQNSVLPMHWIELQTKGHYGTLEKVDLCDDCYDVIAKALETRRKK